MNQSDTSRMAKQSSQPTGNPPSTSSPPSANSSAASSAVTWRTRSDERTPFSSASSSVAVAASERYSQIPGAPSSPPSSSSAQAWAFISPLPPWHAVSSPLSPSVVLQRLVSTWASLSDNSSRTRSSRPLENAPIAGPTGVPSPRSSSLRCS